MEITINFDNEIDKIKNIKDINIFKEKVINIIDENTKELSLEIKAFVLKKMKND